MDVSKTLISELFVYRWGSRGSGASTHDHESGKSTLTLSGLASDDAAPSNAETLFSFKLHSTQLYRAHRGQCLRHRDKEAGNGPEGLIIRSRSWGVRHAGSVV